LIENTPIQNTLVEKGH